MLTSKIFHLQALANANLPETVAPAFHSKLLSWLADANAHHDKDKRRPFTISNLHGDFGKTLPAGYRPVKKGGNFWFRVTTLQPLAMTMPKMPDLMRLGVEEIPFLLSDKPFDGHQKSEKDSSDDVTNQPDFWVKSSTYASLANRYKKQTKLPTLIKMQFASPTTFHTDSKKPEIFTPLPTPERVFDSWLARWKLFAIGDALDFPLNFDGTKFAIEEYALQTMKTHYKDAEWVGFLGTCTFRVYSKNHNALKLANLLADYAYYCGTGSKLSFGLGQTFRVK